jgi:hypothetical protein
MTYGFEVRITTSLRAEWFRDRIPVGIKDFSVLQNVQADSLAYAASSSMVIAVLSPRKSGRDVKLNIFLRLVV